MGGPTRRRDPPGGPFSDNSGRTLRDTLACGWLSLHGKINRLLSAVGIVGSNLDPTARASRGEAPRTSRAVRSRQDRAASPIRAESPTGLTHAFAMLRSLPPLGDGRHRAGRGARVLEVGRRHPGRYVRGVEDPPSTPVNRENRKSHAEANATEMDVSISEGMAEEPRDPGRRSHRNAESEGDHPADRAAAAGPKFPQVEVC